MAEVFSGPGRGDIRGHDGQHPAPTNCWVAPCARMVKQMDWLYLEKAKSYTAEQMLMARTNLRYGGPDSGPIFLKYDLILTR